MELPQYRHEHSTNSFLPLFFRRIKELANGIQDTCSHTLQSLDELEAEASKVSNEMESTINNFRMLMNLQFIENRVNEDESIIRTNIRAGSEIAYYVEPSLNPRQSTMLYGLDALTQFCANKTSENNSRGLPSVIGSDEYKFHFGSNFVSKTQNILCKEGCLRSSDGSATTKLFSGADLSDKGKSSLDPSIVLRTKYYAGKELFQLPSTELDRPVDMTKVGSCFRKNSDRPILSDSFKQGSATYADLNSSQKEVHSSLSNYSFKHRDDKRIKLNVNHERAQVQPNEAIINRPLIIAPRNAITRSNPIVNNARKVVEVNIKSKTQESAEQGSIDHLSSARNRRCEPAVNVTEKGDEACSYGGTKFHQSSTSFTTLSKFDLFGDNGGETDLFE